MSGLRCPLSYRKVDFELELGVALQNRRPSGRWLLDEVSGVRWNESGKSVIDLAILIVYGLGNHCGCLILSWIHMDPPNANADIVTESCRTDIRSSKRGGRRCIGGLLVVQQ